MPINNLIHLSEIKVLFQKQVSPLLNKENPTHFAKLLS